MPHGRAVCLVLTVFISTYGSLADEPVIKRQRRDGTWSIMGGAPTPTVVFDHQVEFIGGLDHPSAQVLLQQQTFRVYTKEEMDAKFATSEKTITALTELVEVLRKNLMDLSDINDALTRRLDEMERRMAGE